MSNKVKRTWTKQDHEDARRAVAEEEICRYVNTRDLERIIKWGGLSKLLLTLGELFLPVEQENTNE